MGSDVVRVYVRLNLDEPLDLARGVAKKPQATRGVAHASEWRIDPVGDVPALRRDPTQFHAASERAVASADGVDERGSAANTNKASDIAAHKGLKGLHHGVQCVLHSLRHPWPP